MSFAFISLLKDNNDFLFKEKKKFSSSASRETLSYARLPPWDLKFRLALPLVFWVYFCSVYEASNGNIKRKLSLFLA